jgi:hypothetical protein
VTARRGHQLGGDATEVKNYEGDLMIFAAINESRLCARLRGARGALSNATEGGCCALKCSASAILFVVARFLME